MAVLRMLYALCVTAALFGAISCAPIPEQQSGDSPTDGDINNKDKVSIWVGGFGTLVIILAVATLSIILVVLWVRHRVKSVGRKEISQRVNDEDKERENAKKAVKYYLQLTNRYTEDDPRSSPPMLRDMGSRMQKYWFRLGGSDEDTCQVLTIAAISQSCPLDLNQDTVLKELMKLFKSLESCRFLQPIEKIGYLDDRKQVIIIQPFMPGGSLKDLIHKESTPDLLDWSQKYLSVSTASASGQKGLTSQQVATFGYQVLKAIRFLYKIGFPVNFLGHVQSGNIFVQDGVCRVGGYENTLLGYRSRFYRMCKDHLEHMDVIMFGHLVFEMSCGYELTTLFPTEQDYQAVRARDVTIEEVLRYVFADGLPHSIKEIKKLPFFKSAKKGSTKIGDIFKELQLKLTSVLPKPEVLKEVCKVSQQQMQDAANKHAAKGVKRGQNTD